MPTPGARDLMRESASQGALTKAVAQQQGLITEAGYEEQAQSYLATSARMAASSENNAAFGADISGVLAGVAAIATLFPGGQAVAAAGQAAGSAMGDPTGVDGLY